MLIIDLVDQPRIGLQKPLITLQCRVLAHHDLNHSVIVQRCLQQPVINPKQFGFLLHHAEQCAGLYLQETAVGQCLNAEQSRCAVHEARHGRGSALITEAVGDFLPIDTGEKSS